MRHEIILNEKYDTIRNFNNVVTPLKDIISNLSKENPSIQNILPDLENLIKRYVSSKPNFGLTFSHKEKKYFYRTTEQFNEKKTLDHVSSDNWAPVEYTLMLGECSTFFKFFSQLKETIEIHKDQNPWLRYINLVNIWNKATLTDLTRPVEFMKRIIAEIENGGLGFENWTNIGTVKTRKGNQQLIVKDTASKESYIEGPRTLKFATIDENDNSYMDHNAIHSVIYGLDGENKATIFSVILDSLNDMSPGRIADKKRLIKKFINIIPTIDRDKKIKLLELLDSWKLEELDQEIKLIYPDDDDSNHNKLVLKELEKLLDFEEHSLVLNKQKENLRRFNKTSGGSSMVSFISTLAIMKKKGINKINIPIYMPLTQHTLIEGESLESLYKSLTTRWIQRLQSIAGFSQDIHIVEDESSILMDITNWDISLSHVNKKNRQLVPLLNNIKIMQMDSKLET